MFRGLDLDQNRQEETDDPSPMRLQRDWLLFGWYVWTTALFGALIAIVWLS
jgi:hypothetical protein